MIINTRDTFQQRFEVVDRTVTRWMARNGLLLLRLGLGIVFLWFGALKLFPNMSPAEGLVRNTIFFLDPAIALPLIAMWEMAIGLGLLWGKYMRLTLLLLFLQMPGTMLPILLLPNEVWTQFPFALTIEGQYIFKNLVLIAAGIVLGGTVRGGYIEPDPRP
jgi:uncharacterized membrane protein YphA (DoxX/SURF4 family)